MPTAPTIHPSAHISDETQLGEGVEIGPRCVLNGAVTLGDGVRLIGSVCLEGPITIGAGTVVYPFACLGFPGQDVKFKPGDETAGVRIGSDTIIREHATVHAATNTKTPTIVGDKVFMMVGTHCGHDSKIGNGCVLVNVGGLSGHAEIEDGVIISGNAGLHQFVRVGRLGFLSGGVLVSMNVPPFCMAPERNRIGGINMVGMRRAGIARDEITMVRRAFREALRGNVPNKEMLEILARLGEQSPAVQEMHDFCLNSERAICPGPLRPPRIIGTWMRSLKKGAAVLDDGDE